MYGSLRDRIPSETLKSFLMSLQLSLVEPFLHPGIDNVLGHSFLLHDGIKNPFHVLGPNETMNAPHIIEFGFYYSSGSVSVPNLPKEDPEAGRDVAEDVFEREDLQNCLKVRKACSDQGVVDASEINEGKGEIGRGGEKDGGRGENLREFVGSVQGRAPW